MHISWQVSFNASLGTFNVAATVDKVLVEGDGKSHMTLTSSLLMALNRQLQFVTYTNTVFHPRTADTGDASASLSAAVNVFARWAMVPTPVGVRVTCKRNNNVLSWCSPRQACGFICLKPGNRSKKKSLS